VCGICGMLSLRHQPVDRPALAAMNATLEHRGPDSEGLLVDRHAAIAMRRLAIVDLAGGDQPIANEDGSVHVVCNGEIYNFRELAGELRARGHVLRTQSDTEVLVHLYEEYGPRCVERLRGMFGIAIWDRRLSRMVLARDRYGIKPLYYEVRDAELRFASELKALMGDPRRPLSVGPDALHAFLAYNAVPSPRTIFREVRKLPPGHLLLVEDGALPVIQRWARPGPSAQDGRPREDERELAEELRSRLRDSVRAHLVADVPVGVLMSGGVDSSVLAALAAGEVDTPLMTFSVGFEDRSFDERSLARMVASRYGTDHHELLVGTEVTERLPEVVAAFDEPFADSSAIPTYLVSELAARHVKVVLSGEGADELFGGYFTYAADLLARRVGRLTPLARPLVDLLPSSTAQASLDYRLKRFVRGAALPAVERHLSWREIFGADARAELFGTAERHEADVVDALRARFAETAGAGPLARLQDLDLGMYLPDDLLVKVDRASMAHSLEARVPYLDPAVTDFALALPDRLKVRGLAKKRLLRAAAGPLLPPEIVHGKKRGFGLPLGTWLRGELEPFAREVLAPSEVARQGFFDPAAVTRLLDLHASRRADVGRQVWNLLVFALWFDRFGSARAGGPVALDAIGRASSGAA
jgi:asparagine synthase (glutamine-hydrolysing)